MNTHLTNKIRWPSAVLIFLFCWVSLPWLLSGTAEAMVTAKVRANEKAPLRVGPPINITDPRLREYIRSKEGPGNPPLLEKKDKKGPGKAHHKKRAR